MTELITQEQVDEEDYRAIEQAVMETARGRWFLAQFAKRNQVSNTDKVLGAIENLKSYISHEHEPADVLQLRLDIADMTQMIEQLKLEIGTVQAEQPEGAFESAQVQLAVVVDETEKATQDILTSAEQVQQVAWEMRDAGGFPEYCDQLDALATEIYTACSFQDLTGQRLRKVVEVTAHLEIRLKGILDVWSKEETNQSPSPETKPSSPSPEGRSLENGPALPGQGHNQSDIDSLLTPEELEHQNTILTDITWSETTELEESDDGELVEPGPPIGQSAPEQTNREEDFAISLDDLSAFGLDQGDLTIGFGSEDTYDDDEEDEELPEASSDPLPEPETQGATTASAFDEEMEPEAPQEPDDTRDNPRASQTTSENAEDGAQALSDEILSDDLEADLDRAMESIEQDIARTAEDYSGQPQIPEFEDDDDVDTLPLIKRQILFS